MAYPGRYADRRRLGRVALVMALLISSPVEAQEPRLARVLAIEPGSVTLSLEPPDASASQTLIVPLAQGNRPSGIRVGGLVRLWPEPEGLRNGSLAGARLDVLGGASGVPDRTGVRARLMQGSRHSASGGGAGGGRGGR